MPTDRLLLAASACLEIVLYNVPRRVKIIWLVMRAQARARTSQTTISPLACELLIAWLFLSLTIYKSMLTLLKFVKESLIAKHGICSSGNLVCRHRVILPESIDRGYFAVVQKFSQEKARSLAAAAAAATSSPLLLLSPPPATIITIQIAL